MKRLIALGFALFVLLNEIIMGVSENAGAFMYLVLMNIVLLVVLRRERLIDVDRMIVVFLVVPLVRVAGLFMDISYIWKMFLGYGVLLFLGMYYLYKFNINLGGVWKFLWALPIVVLSGILVGVLGNFVFAVDKELALIMLLPLVVFSEEIFFRGLMQNSVRKCCGNFYSVLVPAMVYGALSLYLGAGLAVLFFFIGIFSGLLYSSTRNILLSIAFSLPVSVFIFVVPSLI
ncbi:CPBP family intramembrane metalloprotease [archaeon]|nr:CPBP family intramembrane metalloprotease [archaeon]